MSHHPVPTQYRDGIILKNVGQYTITGNTIHSIHPNYEPYSYESLGKESETAHAAVTLPNGIKADHADGIQVANGKGGVDLWESLEYWGWNLVSGCQCPP